MNIFETLQCVEELEQIDSRIRYLESAIGKIKSNTTAKLSKKIDKICFIPIAVFIPIFIFIVYFSCPSYIAAITGNYNMPLWESALAAMCFMEVPFAILVLLTNNIIRKNVTKKEKVRPYNNEEQQLYNQYNSELSNIRIKRDYLLWQLNTSEVPLKYRYSFALEWMADAITCKRANTLQEVINLYEQFTADERRHQEQLSAIGRIRVENNYYYWD